MARMKLTVLGCGTSTGVPVIGCRCAVCTSGTPRNSRLRCSVFISAGSHSNVLIDASPDLRQQALRAEITRVDAVLFTHAHSDHILGTDDLRAFNFAAHSRIPCYGTAATLQRVAEMFSYIFNPDPSYEGGLLAQLDQKPISEKENFDAAGLAFQAFPLGHGKATVLGFRCGEFAYATDCNLIPAESRQLLRGVRYLILDGLRYEPHRTHFTIPQAIEAAQMIGAEKTYLTHTTHTIDYDEVSTKLPPGIFLAYDGLELEFEGTLWRDRQPVAHVDLLKFELPTPRLLLCSIDLSYRDRMFEEFTPEITRFMFPHRESPEATESFIRDSIRTMGEGTNLQLVILKKDSKEFLGCAGLHKLTSGTPELGIWLKKQAHGNGFGLEAITALTAWAREHLLFEYLRYPVDKDNTPSRKIPERLGGTIGRQYSYVNPAGTTLNIVEYCIAK